MNRPRSRYEVLTNGIADALAAATGCPPDPGTLDLASRLAADEILSAMQDSEFLTVPPSNHPEWLPDELDAAGVEELRLLETELHYRREHAAITGGGAS